MDVRARRPSPLHPAGPCSATPPALRLLPCAPLDVGQKDRCPLGTRLREDRARVVNAARARSPFPGTPVAVAWAPRLKSAPVNSERAPPLLLLPPPLTETRCRRSRRLASVTAALHLAAARPSDGAGASLTGASPPPPPLLAPLRSWPPPPLSIPPPPLSSRRPHHRRHRLAPRRRRHRPPSPAPLSAVQGASPRCAASPQCTALSAPLTISEEVVLHSMELGERLASPSARVKCSRASMFAAGFGLSAGYGMVGSPPWRRDHTPPPAQDVASGQQDHTPPPPTPPHERVQ